MKFQQIELFKLGLPGLMGLLGTCTGTHWFPGPPKWPGGCFPNPRGAAEKPGEARPGGSASVRLASFTPIWRDATVSQGQDSDTSQSAGEQKTSRSAVCYCNGNLNSVKFLQWRCWQLPSSDYYLKFQRMLMLKVKLLASSALFVHLVSSDDLQ